LSRDYAHCQAELERLWAQLRSKETELFRVGMEHNGLVDAVRTTTLALEEPKPHYGRDVSPPLSPLRTFRGSELVTDKDMRRPRPADLSSSGYVSPSRLSGTGRGSPPRGLELETGLADQNLGLSRCSLDTASLLMELRSTRESNEEMRDRNADAQMRLRLQDQIIRDLERGRRVTFEDITAL